MKSKIISKEEELKQTKIRNEFEKIKSDYFLKKIFDIVKKNKSLGIMKYNKKLQKRFNLNINDYKEYSQLYTPIEIEIKLAFRKYGKFINVPDKEKEYYHFYFDDSNEEIKRNYLKKNEKVKKVKIIISHEVKSFRKLFSYR